ncbi:MAG: DUF4199 domain-containing protein [Mangrovibacterium sp.]
MNELNNNQQKERSTFWTSVLTAGLIIGGAIVLSDLIIVQGLGLSGNFLVTFCSVFGVYIAQKYYRDTHKEGLISYGMALRFGTFTMAAAGVLRGLYAALLFKFVPGLWDKIMLVVEEAYFNMGVSDADISLMLEPVRNGISPLMLLISFVVASMFSGFFISLLTSIAVKRNSQNPFNDAMRGVK